MASTQQLLLGEGAGGAEKNYIEDVFSTYLYTGNGSTQTITNNIDLSGEGGLVWLKSRSNAYNNNLFDTARGAQARLVTNSTAAQSYPAGGVYTFNSDGFYLGDATAGYNASGDSMASWTFRKQPKFFDVVTYSGTGTTNAVSHNLGSTPGCIIVKRTSGSEEWLVWHSSISTQLLKLNDSAAASSNNRFGTISSTVFTLSTSQADSNAVGSTYVAYLFADDAGGFGLTGSDNVISCGSYTGTGATGNSITLGYEPQWLLIKRTDDVDDWVIFDNMRGMPVGGADAYLKPNLTSAESTFDYVDPTATGFTMKSSGYNIGSGNYIYIAIRRGPMKVPTDATKVFEPVAYTGTGTNNRVITSSITPDVIFEAWRNKAEDKYWFDRLRGNQQSLKSSSVSSEDNYAPNNGPAFNAVQTGYTQGATDGTFFNQSGYNFINYLFKRAPSFMDEVCYTGTGVARTISHNLGVAPELIIVKNRGTSANWVAYAQSLGNTQYLPLMTSATAATNSAYWNNTSPTSSVFSLGTSNVVNSSLGYNFVAYLFASCPGVSKVGSYTGTGATQTINCGFAGGARFVFIRRTDTNGGWLVWDTSRGMVAGSDYSLNFIATTQESNLNVLYTDTGGFTLTSNATANKNGNNFIYLAIA